MSLVRIAGLDYRSRATPAVLFRGMLDKIPEWLSCRFGAERGSDFQEQLSV